MFQETSLSATALYCSMRKEHPEIAKERTHFNFQIRFLWKLCTKNQFLLDFEQLSNYKTNSKTSLKIFRGKHDRRSINSNLITYRSAPSVDVLFVAMMINYGPSYASELESVSNVWSKLFKCSSLVVWIWKQNSGRDELRHQW